MNRKILLTGLLLWVLLPKTAGASVDVTLVADTKGNDVILVWSHSGLYTGYNIYRKPAVGEYEKITSTPITPITSCYQIRRIIRNGSPAWMKLHDIGIDPCEIPSIMDSDTLKRKLILALVYTGMVRIGRVVGNAYLDSRLTIGTRYTYAITGITRKGTETGFLDSVSVIVGTPAPPPAPTGVEAYPGDNKVLIRWTPASNAAGYIVERYDATTGSYVRVNEATMMATCNQTPFGDTLSDTTKLCFTDYLRWKNSEPDSHNVEGNWIKGPFNGVTYTYRVRGMTMLGTQGSASALVSVTPVDSTPPQAPQDIHVTAVGESLKVVWEKVELDVNNHKELQGVDNYKLYRYTSTEDTIGTFVATVPQPTGNTMQVSYLDNNPSLGSPYEDKVYYYRIITVDHNGNQSNLSGPVSGVVKDITPPDPPQELTAEGFTNHIRLRWKKPSAPDVAGYEIYRGICGDTLIKREILQHYPLHLIGVVDDKDSLVFDDYTVPQGSPLCYRYAVRALDRSQNQSDTSNNICEKLREHVPPPAPEIIGLKARDRAVLVEWISAPVQDLFGFVVERKDSSGTWTRVSPRLEFPEKPTCQDIQANSIWSEDTVYSFLDTTVEPKVHYSYRVRGADFNGNIGEPSTPITTYTFDFKHPMTPAIMSVSPSSDGLRVNWRPAFSSSIHRGFIVFRSRNSSGPYHQVSGLIMGNSFLDKNVIHGVDFWYKVQLIDIQGNRSSLSTPKRGRLP